MRTYLNEIAEFSYMSERHGESPTFRVYEDSAISSQLPPEIQPNTPPVLEGAVIIDFPTKTPEGS